MRIELDDLSRPQVLALIEEHLQNMYELSPPDKVFAFDASKLKAPDVSFWTAWNGELLLGCAALKELSSTEGEIKSMRTPSGQRRTGAGRAPVVRANSLSSDATELLACTVAANYAAR